MNLFGSKISIQMRFASRAVKSQVENTSPFGNRISISHHSVSVERQAATSIFRLQPRRKEAIISPFADPANKTIDQALPKRSIDKPMRASDLHPTLLFKIAVTRALFGNAVRRSAIKLARRANLSSHDHSHANTLKRIGTIRLHSL